MTLGSTPHITEEEFIEDILDPSHWLKPALGPNSEDLNAKRLAFHAGPCWLKLLVVDRVAGSIIGKGGKVITEIEQSCNCIMKLSPGTSHFVSTRCVFRSNVLPWNSGANSCDCGHNRGDFASGSCDLGEDPDVCGVGDSG